MPRSLILEPTRELAAQVAENFETYGKHHKLNMALLIGGESFGDQIKKLDRGVDVLIATPGRMIDLFERGNILLSDIKIFVIDEADRMLDMGFIPDIERIVSLLPKIRQTLFFSATMPPEIKRLADSFLMNPREVSVAPPASMSETVTHALTIVQPEDKRRALRHLLNTEDVKNALIFCNRKRDVTVLHRSLEKHGFNRAPCTETCRKASEPRRWTPSREARSRCWCAVTWPRAASTSRASATCSTSTHRCTRRTMSTASAGRVVRASRAAPSPSPTRKRASRSPRSPS